MSITTTLADIRAADPCSDGFAKIRDHLGVSPADAKENHEPFPVALLLETNDLGDALWVLDNVIGNKRLCRLFAADCAESVLPIFERHRPDDDRPRHAISVGRDPNSTDAARAAAGDAARAAAGDAAWAASCAAEAAARAAGAAARAAAEAAARAAGAAAWVAARAAAWVAAAASPQGTPHGTPQGTPHGTPQGPPQGTPHGTPQGPPHGTPQGTPHGTLISPVSASIWSTEKPPPTCRGLPRWCQHDRAIPPPNYNHRRPPWSGSHA
jgi:hypothetical protein